MKLLKSFLLIILALCCGLAAHARSAADFFVDVPSNLIPVIRPQLRMDMVDYFSSGQDTPVRNIYGGESRIIENAPEKIVVQLSRTASLELDVLVSGSDTIVALISTVATPQPDSHISLYSTDWTPRSVQPIMPGAPTFAPKGNRTNWDAEVPIFFVSATFLPESGMFEFTNTTPAYYHPSEMPQALSELPEKIHLRWNGKKWGVK